MILLQLLWAFVQVGAFSFGGGYAALPLIEEQVVKANHWLTAQEFTDIITISQMTPGPIAINSASFVGIRMGGIPGTLVATFGCILPSLIIVLLLSYFFFKYRSKPDLSAVPHRRHRAERQHLSGYGRIVKAKHHFSGCFSGPDMRQKFF